MNNSFKMFHNLKRLLLIIITYIIIILRLVDFIICNIICIYNRRLDDFITFIFFISLSWELVDGYFIYFFISRESSGPSRYRYQTYSNTFYKGRH